MTLLYALHLDDKFLHQKNAVPLLVAVEHLAHRLSGLNTIFISGTIGRSISVLNDALPQRSIVHNAATRPQGSQPMPTLYWIIPPLLPGMF